MHCRNFSIFVHLHRSEQWALNALIEAGPSDILKPAYLSLDYISTLLGVFSRRILRFFSCLVMDEFFLSWDVFYLRSKYACLSALMNIYGVFVLTILYPWQMAVQILRRSCCKAQLVQNEKSNIVHVLSKILYQLFLVLREKGHARLFVTTSTIGVDGYFHNDVRSANDRDVDIDDVRDCGIYRRIEHAVQLDKSDRKSRHYPCRIYNITYLEDIGLEVDPSAKEVIEDEARSSELIEQRFLLLLCRIESEAERLADSHSYYFNRGIVKVKRRRLISAA